MTFKTKPVKRFFHKKRTLFENLQEASFKRSESILLDTLHSESLTINFPFPPFVPIILAWIFIILFPLAFILDPSFSQQGDLNIKRIVGFYIPLLATGLIFYINQKYLVRKCIFKKHYIRYFIFNFFLLFLLFVFREVAFFLVERSSDEYVTVFFTKYCFSAFKGHINFSVIISFSILVAFVCVTSVFYTIILRQTVRTFLQREQKRVALQYELDFLKNQLSPHFLFNTLNNISALIQIDPKRAEESMAKLSSLLRVMLYQTSDETIPLKEEIDILQKYAELEKLRLDTNYDLKFHIDIDDKDFPIVPLIAMPLVENAIKHSINPNGQSFAHFFIEQKGNTVVFETNNTNFPRKAKLNAGGLGLATFKKRLDLLYVNHYKYETAAKDGVYTARLELNID